MEENRPEWKGRYFLPEALAFVTALAGVCAVSLVLKPAREVFLRNLVMTAVGIGIVGYLIRQGVVENWLAYDNGKHLGRFWCCFLLCMAAAFACVFLPVEGWPFLIIFVALSLFSSTAAGVMAGAVLLMITVLLSGADAGSFMLYFVSGVMAASLFRRLDGGFQVGIPVWISMLTLLVCVTANVVLFTNAHLNAEMFVIPAANVIVSGVLLIGILKLFSAKVIYQYRAAYLDLADPECGLLVAFKEKAREEYYLCMHTAYFCDRIARRLGLDSDAVKTAGYYHKIGCMLEGAKGFDRVDELLVRENFPPMARRILREYLSPKAPAVLKETAVLIFAAAVTSSVMYIFSQEKKETVDYDEIIDAVFRKKLDSGVLKYSRITLQEITAMRKIFKEEELYYDFLR